jgi:hypothetical protein
MSRSKRHRGCCAAPIGEPPEGGRPSQVMARFAARHNASSRFPSDHSFVVLCVYHLLAQTPHGSIDEVRSRVRSKFRRRTWDAIAGTVKFLLPPRQSRGISLLLGCSIGWHGVIAATWSA